ncbi:NAD(P)/FAD-dependent oxidoreductase [Clostridioides difficile]|nr:NAD(P)/FAD-dependent oxidoreductase [Clostridioides difficile]
MSKVIVVGGGASGMMAALSASKNNNEVILVERNGELGRKLRATGGGRCNFTNNREIEDFFDKVVSNKKFLYSSFYTFTNKDLISYFESRNLEYKIEEENDHKVYTKNDKSIEVIEVLNKDLLNHNVKIMYNKKVIDIITEEIALKDDSNKDKSKYLIKGIILDNGDKILGYKVIISTGGVSYSKTGSDGSMYKILKKHGHTLNKLYPALVPLTIEEKWIKDLQGISMKNVEISCKIKKRKISKSGDMLFAHFGITGPCVLIMSSYINKIIEKEKVELNIDFLPNLSTDEISSIIRAFPNKNVLNNLKQILPQNFLKEIFSLLSLVDKKASDLSKADEIRIIEYIKNMKLTCNGTTGINTGMVTSGGISVKEINSSTMESKLVKNLFFTGEVIDIDAETGGYNLQIAFSTGYLAGISV